jgi:hypothetical protein
MSPIKPRGPQAKATRADIEKAWHRLRAAADTGDLQASAMLIALTERRPLLPATVGTAA